MSQVTIESVGNIAVLRMINGTTNAISRQMVEELHAAIDSAVSEFSGVVLAGGAKFFSIGLDLPGLLPLYRTEMGAFWDRFNQAVLNLYTLPLPTVCAIAGHATAGGTILALTCDYRYMAAGRKFMGLNEVRIGVPVPYLADLMLRHILNDRTATEVVYGGKFMESAEAHETGLVDELFSMEEVERRALEKTAQLAAMPQPAFSLIKACRVEDVQTRYKMHGPEKTEAFLDCWFEPTVQKLLHRAAEKL